VASGGITGSGGSRASGGVTGTMTGGQGGGTAGIIGASGGAVATGGAGGAATGGAAGATAAWCLPLAQQPMGLDWAKALVDSRMRANPTLTWQYPDGLFLHGVYLAYKRLNDPSYLAYIKKWADANVAGVSPYNSLDDMQPTIVLDDMYRETQDAKYGMAPKAAAMRLESDYPKTSDGGFWHNTGATNQLWGDGVFMDLPAYLSTAQLFGDAMGVDVATNQLIIYDKHIAAPNNLHFHQWDGSANKTSCCEWCRAEGWYEMSLLMVLDGTPTTHGNYAALVAIAQRLAKGLAATQDAATGRWWQVMDKPTDSANWLETSCTAMHTYFLSKASQKGYIDAATYAPLAIKGFMGEMQQVSNPSNVQITQICPGTSVLTTAAAYYAQTPTTNDQHGIGAFLLMYDQLLCH
jgi:unsaturated rhamnogalacturonyl hydrolase